MSYCVNCGVELDATAKKCALCLTPVINPNIQSEPAEQPPFSQESFEIPKPVKKRFLAMLATTIIAIPQIVCFLANAFVFKSGFWSLHVIGAGFLFWVIFIFPFLTKKFHPYLMWCFDTVAVCIHTFFIFALIEINSAIYFEGTLPIIAVNSLLVLIFMLWSKGKNRHWVLKMLFIVSAVAVSAVASGALLSFSCDVRYAFEIGTIIFVSLIAIVIFLSYCYSSKTIRKWLSKRLFV